MPLLTLRQSIYTDPRKPVSFKPGLYVIGSPNELSPVFLTTNYALTYYVVSGDIESSGIGAYLLVADTEGLSVVSAVAGNRLKPDAVADLIKESKLEEKVKHRYLIIPQAAAPLRGDIEDKTGWKVLVGPRDSSQIKGYIEREWKRLVQAS